MNFLNNFVTLVYLFIFKTIYFMVDLIFLYIYMYRIVKMFSIFIIISELLSVLHPLKLHCLNIFSFYIFTYYIHVVLFLSAVLSKWAGSWKLHSYVCISASEKEFEGDRFVNEGINENVYQQYLTIVYGKCILDNNLIFKYPLSYMHKQHQ